MCHLPAWSDMLARTMGYEPFYLVAREGNDICGVLPMMRVQSRLFGNRMISQAFSNYGGMLTDYSEAREAFFTYAVELACRLNCESIELRNTEPLPYDLRVRSEKICMHLALSGDPQELWKSFEPKVRNQVRKAEKSNITVMHGRLELLKDFYNVYVHRMRLLGTPPYPQKIMRSILETFPDNSRIFLAKLGSLTVGGGLTFCLDGFVEIPWAATLVKYNSLCPNNLLYWSVLEHYCLAGAKCFDFGRCTIGESTYQFKKQWGAQPVKLYYQYWARPGLAFTPVTPDNPKYKWRVGLWKKLPLWVTRIIGPYISRNLP
jgi:FemAB-related protein (PEP-CTERM system-associated)